MHQPDSWSIESPQSIPNPAPGSNTDKYSVAPPPFPNPEFYFENPNFNDHVNDDKHHLTNSKDLSTVPSWESPSAPGGDPDQPPDEASSTISELSILSEMSSIAPELTPTPDQHTEPPPHRRANPSRFNEEWRTFFRDSLVAAEPVPTAAPVHVGGTPTAPPPTPSNGPK
jgi:hypothetical protein